MCVPWWQRNAETRERWSAQILHLEARIVARVGGDRHGPCTSHSLCKLNPFQTEAEPPRTEGSSIDGDAGGEKREACVGAELARTLWRYRIQWCDLRFTNVRLPSVKISAY